MKFGQDRKHQWTSFIETLFIILLCEKIYNHSYVSGAYNVQVTLGFTLLSIMLLVSKQCKLIKQDIISLMFILLMILYGFSKETIRYGLTFFSLMVWNKISGINMSKVHRVITILGAGFSLMDLVKGYERISGYSAGSPTLFSCASLISFTYFLFKKQHIKWDYFFAGVNLLMIIKTQSSSTLIVLICMILYKVFINVIKKYGINPQVTKFCIFIGCIMVAFFLVFNFQSALGIIHRGNRNASTSTRLGIYQVFAKLFIKNPITILIGYGGGFTQSYIKTNWGTASHLPVHQDILMFACEYGVLGLVVMYRFLIKHYKFNFLLWVVLVLTSFHNIILSPLILCLLVLTSKSMNSQYGSKSSLWS